MKFEEIQSHLNGIPYIGSKQAKVLYDFILDKKPDQCIELGFAYGASACYVAAALDELNAGHLTAVDMISSKEWQKPSIEHFLTKTKLEKYVTVVRENTCYTWFLKKEIERCSSNNNCQPFYDFCYIDGCKSWTIDGMAFFLIDKLLKEDGWILFDDLNWKPDLNKTNEHIHKFNEMGKDELDAAQIDLVFRFLVQQHPNYSEFKIQDDWWAWAHKIASPAKSLTLEESYNLKALFYRGLRGLNRKFKVSI